LVISLENEQIRLGKERDSCCEVSSHQPYPSPYGLRNWPPHSQHEALNVLGTCRTKFLNFSRNIAGTSNFI